MIAVANTAGCPIRRHSRGFTMIEVMVSLIILSIGLLGLAALQGTGYRFNSTAYQRTQATMVAYDLIDRMRANPTGVEKNKYTVAGNSLAQTYWNTDPTETDCSTDTTCDYAALAAHDLVEWYNIVEALLPYDTEHLPTIERNDVTRRVTITIRWPELGGTCLADASPADNIQCQQWVVDL
jgi:type IV pilus assembly protein PilV